MNKAERQKLIYKIIDENTVSTQEELVRLLNEQGANVTQATMSRDFKKMRITKVMLTDGTYKYTVPKAEEISVSNKLSTMLSQCIHTVDFAMNIVVVKSLSGTANAAAAAIDSLHLNDVVGTIAGDDTLMIVARSERSAHALCDILKSYISN